MGHTKLRHVLLAVFSHGLCKADTVMFVSVLMMAQNAAFYWQHCKHNTAAQGGQTCQSTVSSWQHKHCAAPTWCERTNCHSPTRMLPCSVCDMCCYYCYLYIDY